MEPAGSIRSGTPTGRWVLAAAVLGTGVAFLDGTVVNVALPKIGEDLHTGLSGLQWVLDGYLLTLSALLLLGGSLGDLYGRRKVFVIGLAAFTGASVLCGVAPSVGVLTAARVLQGVGGALLVPGSLALLSSSFRPEDRGRAVGAWSGLAGVSTALGPFVGGWLIDSVSWRFVFLINVPIAAAAAAIALRHVPESRDADAARRPDFVGAALVTGGLAGLVYALIEGSAGGSVTPAIGIAGAAGAVLIVAFVVAERREAHPLVPLSIFRSRQFVGANVTTLTVYAALGGALFLVAVELQRTMGYSALEAGAAFLPITILLLTLSSWAGAVAQRIGPRWPMTVGPIVDAIGLGLLSGIGPGDRYVSGVLPGVVVLGLGMSITVAPLTSAVMAAVDEHHLGVASGLNNAVARVGGLLAVALLPAVSGLAGVDPGAASFRSGVSTALQISAALAAAGGVAAFLLVRRGIPIQAIPQPTASQPCFDDCLRTDGPALARPVRQA